MSDTVVRDEKAGFCSNCRRGDHSLCASASCACPTGKHRNRPTLTVAKDAPEPGQTVQVDPDNLSLPVGVEWCDPPPDRRGGRVDYVTLAAPCKQHPRQWLRVKVFTAKSGAYSAVKTCRPQFGDDWEIRAAHLPEGGSGLWVRYVGEKS